MINQIQIFNSLSNKKEPLIAIDPDHLKLYVCGPTVYDRPHLGNARSIVIYDLFFRFLSIAFKQVTYARNITDVDDKINKAAIEQNISINELTDKILDYFYADLEFLRVLRPTIEPKATDHIKEMISMIEILIKNNHAYESDGHVLFDVESYKNYGALSNRSLEEMIAGARVEIASYKKNPLDFVLWKPASPNDDSSSIFDSPWSKGRPGWHIECSAMSSKYLGQNFDIHGGGADLQFPHHENEIAQSICSHPGSSYAKYWVHNGFLTVNGEKMSKSLKNFFTVADLKNKNISGAVIRFFLLSSHYRKPLDFNENALKNIANSLEKFHQSLSDLDNFERFDINNLPDENFIKNSSFITKILNDLADDLNIAKVTASLHQACKDIKKTNDHNLKKQLAFILDFLGIFDENLIAKKSDKNIQDAKISDEEISNKIAQRLEAKLQKNYQKADEIRNDLLQKGIILEDKPNNQTIWKRN